VTGLGRLDPARTVRAELHPAPEKEKQKIQASIPFKLFLFILIPRQTSLFLYQKISKKFVDPF
jgi:hypothetical protein